MCLLPHYEENEASSDSQLSYEPAVPKSDYLRAPNPRLSHLEEENQALRNRLVNTGASSSFGPLSASQPATPRLSKSDSSGLSFISERSATAKTGDKSSKSRSLSTASEDESSTSNDWVYQGLTSASVLSDTSASHPPSPAQSVDFSIPHDDIRRELEKEAAFQRKALFCFAKY